MAYTPGYALNPPKPQVDPGQQSADDLEQLSQTGAMGHLQNTLTAEAGQNHNASLIGALPAYGTASGQSQANALNASSPARLASFQALLKAVGF
jgi:hypothetical protein